MKKLEERYRYFVDYFSVHQPAAETELDYKSPYELLVATILSAQCTDKRVNMITPDFSIYPNPATNKISIETKSNLQGETTICIFNMNGALLQQEKFQSQNLIELDVSALAKGFYLIKIQTNKGIETKKLVVE